MSNYSTHRLDMGVVRSIFGNITEDEYAYNWLFTSTSGIHGFYLTLHEIMEWWTHIMECTNGNTQTCLLCKGNSCEKHPDCSGPLLTVLVVKPRIVQTLWGTVLLESQDDINLILEAAQKTKEFINGKVI